MKAKNIIIAILVFFGASTLTSCYTQHTCSAYKSVNKIKPKYGKGDIGTARAYKSR